MDPWLVVWLVVGIVSTLAILACLIGLVRHLLVLGRTLKQLQQEMQPIVDDMARGRQRAGEHASTLGPRRRSEPPPGTRGVESPGA